jgi:membrane associated rhomboid family serine protease
MFRKTRGAILCPYCGRLTNAEARECLVCGRRNPGLWGFAGPLRVLFRRRRFTDVVTVVCIAAYVISLLIDPSSVFRPRGFFADLAPSNQALLALGATGAWPMRAGAWWTLFTAIYLHAGILHILFNLLWIRQLGPAVEELYGPARTAVVFTVSGVVGFIVSNAVGIPLTVGASGSIFGLLGAIVAYGRRRGGAFGAMVLRQYGMWALLLFAFGFFMPGVNNFAHAGGFVGGLACGYVLSFAEHRAEHGLDQILATGCLVVTAISFGLALWAAL